MGRLRFSRRGCRILFEAAAGHEGVEGGVLHDAALLDDDHAVAHGLDLLHDVGGEDDGAGFAELRDQIPDFLELERVEAGGGLVEDEQLRVVQDGLGEADALLVALGEAAIGLCASGVRPTRSMVWATLAARPPCLGCRAVPP